jgi:hypothetical protein
MFVKYVVFALALSSVCMSAYVDNSKWMGEMKDVIYNKKLTDVILPGTHDSGAYRLDDAFAPGSDLNSALQDIVKIAKFLHIEGLYNLIRGWAISQSGNIYEQLNGGIRFIDLRAAFDNSTQTWRTDHMLMGDEIDTMIAGVEQFIDENPSEIVVIQISHYAVSFTDVELDTLAKIFLARLGSKMFERKSNFDFTIGDMVASNKRVLVTASRDRMYTAYTQFWPDYVFEGGYANSNDLATMEQHNLQQLQQYGGEGKLFLMFFTLTMQGASDVERGILDPSHNPHTLYTLASVANPDFDRWVRQVSSSYQMSNILMTDWFENTTLIETVKRINRGMDHCIDQEQYRNPQSCRAWINQCSNDPQAQDKCPLTCGKCSVNTYASIM